MSQTKCPPSTLPPRVPASTRALDEPDIWHGRTQCASAGTAWPDKAALCGRLPVPCHERCPPVPSPPGSTAQPEAAAPSGTGISPRQPRAGHFPMYQSLSCTEQPCHKHPLSLSFPFSSQTLSFSSHCCSSGHLAAQGMLEPGAGPCSH